MKLENLVAMKVAASPSKWDPIFERARSAASAISAEWRKNINWLQIA